MGNGNASKTKANFSTSIYLKNVASKTEVGRNASNFPIKNTDDSIETKLKSLKEFKIYDALKKGEKISCLIEIKNFENSFENVEILLRLNKQIKEFADKISLAGLISSNLAKNYCEIYSEIEKCFKNKKEILDLESETNKKRLFSILKLMVNLLNSARFFKEEGVFSEGKWWKPMKDEHFLLSLQKKIMKKCDSILENYENVYFSFKNRKN